MAWAILITIAVLQGGQLALGISNLFKQSSEPTGPFRRPRRRWPPPPLPRRMVFPKRLGVPEKVNWKEEGF